MTVESASVGPSRARRSMRSCACRALQELQDSCGSRGVAAGRRQRGGRCVTPGEDLTGAREIARACALARGLDGRTAMLRLLALAAVLAAAVPAHADDCD